MNLPKSDLHIHTWFCDGSTSPEGMIRAAVLRGFHTVGISGHSFTPFDRSWCMNDEGGYRREMARLKEAYAGQISVQCGIECDAESELPEGYDYVIGSVHYLRVGDRCYPVDESPAALAEALSDGFQGNERRMIDTYFREVVDMTARLRPDIVGHFDLLTKFAGCGSPLEVTSAYYRAAAREALSAAVKNCPRFEVNTGAISRGYRAAPYPSEELLRALLCDGGTVILSSDAHSPRHIGFGFGDACRMLFRVGFRSVDVRSAGRFTPFFL